MAIDINLKAHFPFDDPDGTTVYDYSQTREDGILSNGAYLSKDAKFGKALAINGTGECQVPTAIPFNSDFTLLMYVRPFLGRIGWLLNFSGINNYIEKWEDVQLRQWISLVFVKEDSKFTAYLNSNIVQEVYLNSNPIGLSLNDESLYGTEALIDEVMMFDKAKTFAEILKLNEDKKDVEYFIGDRNFKEFGVHVSGSSGIIGMLERKEPLTVDWDSYHGVVVDTKRPRYKERIITLDCFIEASSKTNFVERVQLFMSQFQKPDTQRLKIEYDGRTKPLYYEVFSQSGSDVEKNWTYDNDLMVGTFRLTLIEPEPVKRVIRHIGGAGSTASMTLSSHKLLNIFWGDGSITRGVSGSGVTQNHTYTEAGEYDIVITGVIEDITSFTTNAIIVWNKLL